MENRCEPRSQHAIELLFGCNDTFCPGTTLNISPHGMHIHAESRIVPIDREIKLLLTLGSEVVGMRGIVCWNCEVLGLDPEADRHLGIYIPDPHPDYVTYIRSLN
ncbi:MAG: PilZ domain-containing protein [Candidatus Aminicenantes bacterium]|nr:PilZ domain-containing protein [Candidatus Aminicenantes bacterium]